MDLYIKIAVISLILFLLIFFRIKLIYVYGEGNSALKIRTCFITLTLINTKKKKKAKKSRYSEKAIQRRKKKELKALRKKQKKQKDKTFEDTGESTQNKKRKSAFKFPDDIEDLLSALSTLFGEILHPIIRNSRIHFKYFTLTVASSDPADTAIYYGAVSQAAAYFLSVLSSNAKLSDKEMRKVNITYDFLAEKSSLSLCMSVTFGIWKLLYILVRGFLKLLKKWTNFKSKRNPEKASGKKIKSHKFS